MKKQLLLSIPGKWKRMLSLCLTLACMMSANAQTVIIDQVQYTLRSDNTVEFTFPKSFTHSVNELVIPENVTINGTSYPVKYYIPYRVRKGAWPTGMFDPYGGDYDDENPYGLKIKKLIIKAQIESIEGYFPPAVEIIFPKSLKLLRGPLQAQLDNTGQAVLRVSFEEGSQLEEIDDLVLYTYCMDPGSYFDNTYFELPASLKRIGTGVFTQSQFNRDTNPLPNNLEEIGPMAFFDTEGSSILKIPASVKHICTGAFSECWGLRVINIEGGDNLTIDASAFSALNEDYTECMIERVICNSTIPFNMYSKPAGTIEIPTYSYSDSPQEFTFYGKNFPLQNGRKVLLIVPKGSAATYKAKHPLDDETITYDDIFNIVEGDSWGTIVVPTTSFTVGNTDILRLAELKSCDISSEGAWRVVFDEIPIHYTYTLTRGKPYLCMPPNIGVVGSYPVTDQTTSDNGYTVTFTGNLTGSDSFVPKGAYYFGKGSGKCYLNEKDDDKVLLKNGRCYFTVSAPEGAKPATIDLSVNELTGYQEVVTAIEGIAVSNGDADESKQDAAIYNLQGVRMNAEGELPKGVYIQNGKKIVIK